MNEEDKCLITLKREDLLNHPDILKDLYLICDRQKIIDWMLKKKTEENSEEKKDELPSCCSGDADDES